MILTKLPDAKYFSEEEMQEEVEKALKGQTFWKQVPRPKHREEVNPIFLKEFRIPEVGRISDLIMYFSKNKIINIECKKENYIEVIKQAEDHLRWCDYSYICLPLDKTYIPNKYKMDVINKGIGLMFWLPEIGLFQFINAKFNRNKNKVLREDIGRRIGQSIKANIKKDKK